MCFERAMKPTLRTFGIFIVFAIILAWFFASAHVAIFPCKVQPVVPNPPAFTDSTCAFEIGPYFSIGARKEFTAAAYAYMAVIFLAIPYLLAALVEAAFDKKK